MKKKKKKKGFTLPPPLEAVAQDARDWCNGRLWWPRLLLLFFLLHILVSHIKDPLYSDAFKGINLGFHEMGHMVFAPLGEFWGIAGGSIFQCLVPLLSTVMFFRQRDYFGIAFCFAWLSTNLFDVATYAEDARKLELPLVTPFKGDETIHDWNFILDKLNLLQDDYKIAAAMRISATLSMLFCFVMGGWLIYRMMLTKKAKQSSAFLTQDDESGQSIIQSQHENRYQK